MEDSDMTNCPYCGMEVDEFDSMCPRCGKELMPSTSHANTSASTSSGYNAYGGGNSVSSSYGSSSYGASGSYGTTQSGSSSSYNAYGGGQSSGGSSSGYNAYGGGQPSGGSSSGYNAYGGGQPSGGSSSGYNAYGGGQSSGGSSSGYNAYGGGQSSGGSSSGYNPYSGDAPSTFSGDIGMEEPNSKPTYTSNEAGKYSDYNQKLDTVRTTNKMIKKERRSASMGGFIKILLAILIVVAAVYYGAPWVKDMQKKPYKKAVQTTAEAMLTVDIDKMDEISCFKLSDMKSQFVRPAFAAEQIRTANLLKETYGEDYKVTTEIRTIKNLAGEEKKTVLSNAKQHMYQLFAGKNKEVPTLEDYFQEEEIAKVVKVTADRKISGGDKEDKDIITVYLATFDSQSEWKLLDYEEIIQ